MAGSSRVRGKAIAEVTRLIQPTALVGRGLGVRSCAPARGEYLELVPGLRYPTSALSLPAHAWQIGRVEEEGLAGRTRSVSGGHCDDRKIDSFDLSRCTWAALVSWT